MSFDSNPRCLVRGCTFNCCDVNGTCPGTPSLCYYAYNSYYCYNNCTSQYYYSSGACSSTCTTQTSLNQGLIYGCIFGGFFFILIVSSLILYKCNKKKSHVATDAGEVDQSNQASSVVDNSLSTINEGQLHSVMNKKQSKSKKGTQSQKKIRENKKIQGRQSKQAKQEKQSKQVKQRKQRQKAENKKIQQKRQDNDKKQLKPTYGKTISLQRKAMIPDFSF